MEVYLITNLINDKKYVGITSVGYKERYKQHKLTAKNEYDKRGKNQSGYPLYNSMRKYGIDNFELTLLEKVDTFERACELEKKYIKELNTYINAKNNRGYNQTKGGEGGDSVECVLIMGNETIKTESRGELNFRLREIFNITENVAEKWIESNIPEEYEEKIDYISVGNEIIWNEKCREKRQQVRKIKDKKIYKIIVDGELVVSNTKKGIREKMDKEYGIKEAHCWFNSCNWISNKYKDRVTRILINDVIWYDSQENYYID